MLKKRNLLGILALVLTIGLTIIGCGGNPLEGTWVHSDGYSTITFGRETVTMDGETGSYSTNGNNITINLYGGMTGTFSIDGDILNITIDGYRETFTRRR